jgi:hypothetical protein
MVRFESPSVEVEVSVFGVSLVSIGVAFVRVIIVFLIRIVECTPLPFFLVDRVGVPCDKSQVGERN